jgi:hypothetical protein
MAKNFTYVIYYRKEGMLLSLEVAREENKNKLLDSFTKKGYTNIKVERKYYTRCLLVNLTY